MHARVQRSADLFKIQLVWFGSRATPLTRGKHDTVVDSPARLYPIEE